MATIVLHLGAHRTGSTHLQYNLNANKKELEEAGIKYFRFHEDKVLREEAIKLRRGIRNDNFNASHSINFIQYKIDKLINGFKYAIISYEGILGELNLYESQDIYPNTEELLKIYKQIFSRHNVIPAFSTRNYTDFILSTYKYEVKNGMPLSLDQYTSNIKIDKNRWSKIISAIDEEFDTKIIWTFEVYKKNSKSILNNIISALDTHIDTDSFSFVSEKKNYSSGNNIVKCHYSINKYLNHSPNNKGFLKLICRKLNYTISSKYSGLVNSNYWLNCFDIDIEAKYNNFFEYKDEVKKFTKI